MGEYTTKNYIFVRDDEKEKLLKETRNISFWDVIHAIEYCDGLLNIIHPNQDQYPKQKKLILLINEYPHEVPYKQENWITYLKTIIPSRKYKYVLPYEW